MENLKEGLFTKDEFAKEFFAVGLSLRAYHFDVFYDINCIVRRLFDKTLEGNDLYLFLRDTGTHTFWSTDSKNVESDIEMYSKHNERGYKISFPLGDNHNYTFAKVEQIFNKKEAVVNELKKYFETI